MRLVTYIGFCIYSHCIYTCMLLDRSVKNLAGYEKCAMDRNVLCLSCHPHARDVFWLPHTCVHVCDIEEVVLTVVTLVLRPDRYSYQNWASLHVSSPDHTFYACS